MSESARQASQLDSSDCVQAGGAGVMSGSSRADRAGILARFARAGVHLIELNSSLASHIDLQATTDHVEPRRHDSLTLCSVIRM